MGFVQVIDFRTAKIEEMRKLGDLPNSDFVMRHVFWVGVFPGLTEEMLAYVISTFREFCAKGR